MNTLIVSGGEIDLNFFKNLINENKYDTIIASDKGLEILDKLSVIPRYIIGDFDSINQEILNKYLDRKDIEITRLNPIKDYTDTHMALKLALDIKSNCITIVGAIGTRIDHILGNINVLKEALDKDVECKIINKNNEIGLINKKIIIKKDIKYKYISLIPLTSKAIGVSLKGFKYNLENHDMSIGESLGISNEQIEDEAEIDIKEGIMILIKSND